MLLLLPSSGWGTYSHEAGVQTGVTVAGSSRTLGLSACPCTRSVWPVSSNFVLLPSILVSWQWCCRKMLDAGTPGLHMYTLNLERGAVSILEKLGLIDRSKVQPRQQLSSAAVSN